MIDAAVNGYGIAYVPNDIVERPVASGELVQVLDDWLPLFDGYFLYYASRRQYLPRSRSLRRLCGIAKV